MQYGKAAILLCATLALLSADLARAASAQDGSGYCSALYSCEYAHYPYKAMVGTAGGCGCCNAADPDSVNMKDCVTATKLCKDEYCTSCGANATNIPSNDPCVSCYTGYQLVHGSCVTCNVPNCEICMTNSTGILAKCQLCKDTYHWSAGTCVANTAGSGANGGASGTGASGSGTSGGNGVTQCRAAHCKTCASTSATQCATCVDGYTLDASNNCVSTCTAANCDLCYAGSTTDCKLCASGYTWKNSQCVLASGCRVGHCTSCEGENLSASASKVNEAVCAICDSGYVVSNGYCMPKQTCTDPHCASCPSSPSQCTTCNAGYGLVNGVCTACADPHCNHCDNDVNVCTGCALNWFLTRYATCSPVACSLEYCLMCNATNPTRCVQCQSPRIVDVATGRCFLSGNCSVANCEKCSATSASLCETCKAGYLPSTDMKTCSATASSTSTPTNSPTGGCRVPNCQTCVASNPDTCQTCNNGYYVSNGQCVLTGSCYVENCAQCMLRDSSKCSTCRNGYLLSSTFTCLSQHVSNGAAAPHSLWVAAAVLLASALTYLA
jgi:hypothetical protein